MAHLTITNRFSQMINFAVLGDAPATLMTNRMTIAENQHIILPATVTSIRVLSGKAWISYLGNNLVLKTGETMEFETGRPAAIVTSLGYKSVKVELIQ